MFLCVQDALALVPNCGTRWHVPTMWSNGIIPATGHPLWLAQVTGNMPVVDSGQRNGLNHSIYAKQTSNLGPANGWRKCCGKSKIMCTCATHNPTTDIVSIELLSNIVSIPDNTVPSVYSEVADFEIFTRTVSNLPWPAGTLCIWAPP
jgi:hypothetical protein